MDYATLKLVHQGAVALSIGGFFVRGVLSLLASPLARTRLARTLPHAVDSVLLLSALALAGMAGFHPGNSPWITAKLAGLVVYIGLGVVALKPGRPVAVRAVAWGAALATVGWIVSVAVTKNPLGYLAVSV
jgi:uncharacterized membrane protein SirB2